MRFLSFFLLSACLMLPACVGGSGTDTLDVDKADSAQVAVAPDQLAIPVGMPEARVLQLLGPADDTETDSGGRKIWRYTSKLAEYVYVANENNVNTMVIGHYVREPSRESLGFPLILTIIMDPARKVADFSFSQISF